MGREVVRDWDGLEGIGELRRGVKFEEIGREEGGGGNGLLDWSGGRGGILND